MNLNFRLATTLLISCMLFGHFAARSQMFHYRNSIFHDSRAVNGVGVKLGMYQPRKDFGSDFKQGMGVEVYFAADHLDGWLTQKAGLMYTQFSPKADTIPNHPSPSGKGTSTVKFDKVPIYGLFIDESFRFFYTHHVSVHGGIGLMIGQEKYSFIEYSQGVQVGETSLQNFVGGVRNHLSLDYTIGSKCRAYFEVLNNIPISSEQAWKTPYNVYSVGLIYYFADVDEF